MMNEFRKTQVILVVDDNPTVRQTMSLMLAEESLAVYYAEDGYSAYDLAVSLQPDLILLDVMMPMMDGFDVCRKLRQHPELGEVPIVMVTALDDRESRIRGIEAGADDFLSKPVDLIELKARVKTILRLNRFRNLQKERAQFKWAVEQAGEGYLLLDPQDCIVYANPKARSFLGLGQDEEHSARINFLAVAGRQFARFPESLWQHWREPSSQPRFLMIPETSSSRAFWLEVDVFPGLEDDPLCLVCLRNVSAAVNADQDFKKFHYLISHKLNTPLNGVYGVVELLNMSAGDMSRSELKDLSQLALVSAERLRLDVKDILGYVQASASARQGESLKLVQIPAMAQEISKDLGLKPAVVRVAAAVHAGSLVLSKISFELILNELFENSKKFHPQHDPQLSLSVSRIDEDTISIRVADDGLNLTLEQREAMVIPYRQMGDRLTGEEKGFGLGIPMVVSILQSVGGRLNLYNVPDGPGLVVEMLVPSGPETSF